MSLRKILASEGLWPQAKQGALRPEFYFSPEESSEFHKEGDPLNFVATAILEGHFGYYEVLEGSEVGTFTCKGGLVPPESFRFPGGATEDVAERKFRQHYQTVVLPIFEAYAERKRDISNPKEWVLDGVSKKYDPRVFRTPLGDYSWQALDPDFYPRKTELEFAAKGGGVQVLAKGYGFEAAVKIAAKHFADLA